jgi:hypothetical protein
MRLSRTTRLAALVAIAFTLPAIAQSGRPAPADTATPPQPQTAKERLGRKWTDEQRVDNCNVPPDKRGSKPRPDCADAPSR